MTIQEAAEKYNHELPIKDMLVDKIFIDGAKSDAARDYWEKELTKKVNRVEVINHSVSLYKIPIGRAFGRRDCNKVEIQLQDLGKTLKVFIK